MSRGFHHSHAIGRKLTVAAIALATCGAFSQGVAGSVRPDAGPAASRDSVNLRVLRTGNGTVSSTPAGIRCGAQPGQTTCVASFGRGGTIHLAELPDSGWAFQGWGAPCSNAAQTCEVTLNANTTVNATFIRSAFELASASFEATWSRSVLTGTLVLTGTAGGAGQLTLTLTPPSGPARTFQVTVAAGPYNQSVKLPKTGFFPGTYKLRITGTVSGAQIAPKELTLTLAAPKEGVVSKAWISAFGGSAPVARLPASAIGATAHFVFAANPFKGSNVTATWFRNKKKFFGPVGKPRTKNVTSFVGVSGGHLPGGFYTCVLKARGIVVKQVGIQVG
jgi:hypothetical protein